MDKEKSTHRVRVLEALCLFALIQIMILLVLNFIPIVGEWASVVREWVEMAIGLY